ncbi:hypothetical protein [Actinomadura sp. 6N118]|uniref:hypothetical protein n=1 Tax=Actinomadura sp. 6N118 TaxID=3375151 RepID=UPI0037AFCBBB
MDWATRPKLGETIEILYDPKSEYAFVGDARKSVDTVHYRIAIGMFVGGIFIPPVFVAIREARRGRLWFEGHGITPPPTDDQEG